MGIVVVAEVGGVQVASRVQMTLDGAGVPGRNPPGMPSEEQAALSLTELLQVGPTCMKLG